MYVLYCPKQAPMDARNSSAKIWGLGSYTEKMFKCFNQGPTPDAKLAAMGLNRLALPVCPCFVEASPTVEKVVSCYKAD